MWAVAALIKTRALANLSCFPLQNLWLQNGGNSASPRTILTAFNSSARTVEVIQRYQLNHRHDGADHNEARAEDALAMG